MQLVRKDISTNTEIEKLESAFKNLHAQYQTAIQLELLFVEKKLLLARMKEIQQQIDGLKNVRD